MMKPTTAKPPKQPKRQEIKNEPPAHAVKPSGPQPQLAIELLELQPAPTGYSPRGFNVRLTEKQAQGLRIAASALKDSGAKIYRDSSRQAFVSTPVDAMRWILEQLAEANGSGAAVAIAEPPADLESDSVDPPPDDLQEADEETSTTDNAEGAADLP